MSLLSVLRKRLIKRYPLFDGCALCPDRIDWKARRNGFSLDFPIDMVFTWVNGNDPAHQAKRAYFLQQQGIAEKTIQAEQALYRDNEELRYALRAIEAYAPWVRRIFILTDSQEPAWLNEHHPKITLIDHRECIPEAFLPTFNSHVIEAHLHRIPGLSEHFIYCNDDFFLINSCEPEDFFTLNGIPYIFTDWRFSRAEGYKLKGTPHAASYHNTRTWLQEKLGQAPELIVAHIPYPLTKGLMEAAYSAYQGAIQRFGPHIFREMDEMAFPCHAVPLLAYIRKQAVPKDMPYYYINSKRFDRNTYYEVMLREKENGDLPPFLCINDVGDGVSTLWQDDMHNFLKAFYPDKSAFEI